MRPHCVFDFPDVEGGPRRLLAFTAPREVLRADRLDAVRAVLREAEERAHRGAWVCGFVAYDAAPAFDAALRVPGRQQGWPLAWFAVFDAPMPAFALPSHDGPPVRPDGEWRPDIDRTRFEADVAVLRQKIFDGAAYQINHTLRLHNRFHGDDLAWFSQLHAAQPAGYCAWLDLGRQRILSASPELFFCRAGEVVTARPMKGTAARGRWSAEDRSQAGWLHNSAKNRAENLMIVDLLRNDLSRIARPHGVAVSDLFAVERHPTLWQMTSTVRATARAGISLEDIFAALFPCGSVTGAPKAKAMELIATLENAPRGLYCGAIGLLRPGGDAMFNVAIRTVTLDAETGEALCGVGGGITWDSTSEGEYGEALLKSRFLDDAPGDFRLIETLRLDGGTYFLLERHLRRLNESAAYFGFACDIHACRRRLDAWAQEKGHRDGTWRVRLTLGVAGDIDIAVSPMPPIPGNPPEIVVAGTSVQRDSVWLHHKTTRRAVYEQALAAHPEAFDVLLCNEAGELTEFTRGNLVLDIDGVRYTPPQSSGLLDGTLRREWIERGALTERVLTQDDLRRAQRIFFINGLRGEIEVRLRA